MDSKVFVKVLEKIYSRLLEMNNFNAVSFRDKYFCTEDAIPLDEESRKLYQEHMSVTELCNDVHDVISAFKNFDL